MATVVEKIGDYLATAEVSREALQDKLSELSAVEKGGVALYTAALRMVFDRKVSARFKTFRDQTRNQERILLGVIDALGMDADYTSPGAKVAQQKVEALLKTMVASRGLSTKAAELNAVENIVLAETKGRADWEFLGKLARRTSDANLRQVLQAAVSEAEPQEYEHLNWTRNHLARLEFSALTEKAHAKRATRRRRRRTRMKTRSTKGQRPKVSSHTRSKQRGTHRKSLQKTVPRKTSR
jgi:rubrerythrin